MAEINFSVPLFLKFWENVIWPMKVIPLYPQKYFSGKRFKSFCIQTDNTGYFWRRFNRFQENTYMKKITLITKPCEFSRTLVISFISVSHNRIYHSALNCSSHWQIFSELFQVIPKLEITAIIKFLNNLL